MLIDWNIFANTFIILIVILLAVVLPSVDN